MRKIHNLDSIRNRVNEIFGNKYIVPDQEIDGVKNKIIVFCKDCEQYFKIRLNSLLSGKGCIDCWYNSMRLSIDEIRTISFEKYGNKYYIPNQEIKNNKSKIKINIGNTILPGGTYEII